jgi:hypothetical protein
MSMRFERLFIAYVSPVLVLVASATVPNEPRPRTRPSSKSDKLTPV